MSDTKIAWTKKSWNPVVGCSKVSPGCINCYAEKMAVRLANILSPATSQYSFDEKGIVQGMREGEKVGWSGRTVFVESALEKPLHWKKPCMIFVPSMGDLFHESVPFEWIDRVMAIIALCPQHTFQILTKRPERMAEYFKYQRPTVYFEARKLMTHEDQKQLFDGWPLPNLWFGWTAENQKMMDLRTPIGLQIPAAKRFVSIEPMLEGVDINQNYNDGKFWGNMLSWVIVGCESGPKRRPCKMEWVRSIVEQCKTAGVPVFVKQVPINGKVTDKMELFPEDLRIREFPEKEQSNGKDN